MDCSVHSMLHRLPACAVNSQDIDPGRLPEACKEPAGAELRNMAHVTHILCVACTTGIKPMCVAPSRFISTYAATTLHPHSCLRTSNLNDRGSASIVSVITERFEMQRSMHGSACRHATLRDVRVYPMLT